MVSATERLWHGGIPGLKVGDVIEPHEPNYMDNCEACQANRAGENHPISPLSKNPDKVYVTTDREYARFYASKFPVGDLYRVEAVGELSSVGREDRFPSFAVEAARIVGVYDRAVIMTPGERSRLVKRWKIEDDKLGIKVTYDHGWARVTR